MGNKNYFAVYKCTLCNRLMAYGDAKEIPYDVLPDLCGRVIRNQMFKNNPVLYQAPMCLPHKCADGSCGMAYFAGFKVADKL